jgi:hypothetical protein
MKGKMLLTAAVLALVLPAAVSAKLGGSAGNPAPASSLQLPAPVAKSPATVADAKLDARHDGTCNRAVMYEL